MSRLFYHTMQDNAGNLLFGVSGTMRLAGSGTLATIYGDEALTVILPNPMTNHPSFGSFKCFLGAGDYDFHMAKAGYTFETLTGVQGHGTMAQQDADAVTITGGIIEVANLTAGTFVASTALISAGDITAANITAGAFDASTATIFDQATLGTATPFGNGVLSVRWPKATKYGVQMRPSDADAGSGHNMVFFNLAGTEVGSIQTTGSGTSYATTSDARLKHDISTLIGELAVIRALRPVRFKWLVDDSEGVGFLAGEVAEHVPGVVMGEADAVDAEGGIVPQQIDMSKLVPWLVGALQTLAARVETLTERVTELETGLGV